MDRTSRRGFDQDQGDLAAAPILARRLVIRGTVHDDSLIGTAADEIFKPRAGEDEVVGGGGADAFYYGTDFRYSAARYGIDTILDFSHAEGDQIGFSIIDADRTIRGRQEFDFVGDAAISDADIEFILIVHADAPFVTGDFEL